jgi:N utilization substance protein B
MQNDQSKRRRAREAALQVLFQKEFVTDMDTATSLAYFRDQLDFPADSWSYAEQLLNGVEKHKTEIDALITSKSQNWKISRMAPVDLNLLRIATYEIRFSNDEVPPKVAINEALEIAKRYSGTDSAQFINGLLDEILKARS